MTTHSDLPAVATQPPAILGALAAVMQNIGAITKANTTQGGARFKFRGIEQFMNALHPLMAQHGIIVLPQVEAVDREERTNQKGTTLIWTVARIRFEFISTVDGSQVSTTVIGEGMDSGDKGMNKAMSIGLKYAVMQMLMIPTEETIDPDNEVHEVAPKKQDPQRAVILEALKSGAITGDEVKHMTGKASMGALTQDDVQMLCEYLSGKQAA